MDSDINARLGLSSQQDPTRRKLTDALWVGLFNAVQAYLKELSECRPLPAPSKE
jgi:hypothetical protein